MSTTLVKVHGAARSTCTMRVLTALAEKNVDCQLTPVNMMLGEHKQPPFLAIQPFGLVPVLQDEDVTLFESRAIIRYIAEKYKDQGSALYGSTLEEKAVVEQWMEVEGQNYNPAIQPIFFQLVIAPLKGMPTDHKIVEASSEKLAKVLDVYEDHLKKHEYLAGDFFSLADLSHLPYTHYLINNTDQGGLFTSRKNVNAWWQKISSRPSWKKVVAQSMQK